MTSSVPTELAVSGLVEAAKDATGLSDFGPWPWRDGLEVLVETYERAALTEAGLRSTVGRLKGLLETRLRVARAWAEHQRSATSPSSVRSLWCRSPEQERAHFST